MDGFEILPHQGDMAARVWADSVDGLFAQAARAMGTILTEAAVEPREERALALEAEDGEGLLVRFLNELLFLFETEGWLSAAIEVRLSPGWRLSARVRGERLDPARHPIERVIKSTTEHALAIRETDGVFRAEIVFDL